MEFLAIQPLLGIIAGILGVFALFPYLRDIVRGNTKPNIVSWTGWSFLTAIATVAQFAEGASWSVVVPLSSTIGTAVIALFGFKYGYTKFDTLDKLCFLLGGFAIALWLSTGIPLLALIFSLIADLIVGFPTIVKAYRDPKSETPATWFIFTTAAFFGILASNNLDIHNLLFPVYLLFFDGTVSLLIIRNILKKRKIG